MLSTIANLVRTCMCDEFLFHILAKEYMGQLKLRKQKQQKKQQDNVDEDPFLEVEDKMESSIYSQCSQSIIVKPKRGRERPRSNTITSVTGSSDKKQPMKWSLRSGVSKRHSAVFYKSLETTDVTTPFVEPIELKNLKVQDKSQSELLDLLNQV